MSCHQLPRPVHRLNSIPTSASSFPVEASEALTSFEIGSDWDSSGFGALSIAFGGLSFPSFEYHRFRGRVLANGPGRGAAGLDRIARALHAPQTLDLGDMAELRVASNEFVEQGTIQARGSCDQWANSRCKIPRRVVRKINSPGIVVGSLHNSPRPPLPQALTTRRMKAWIFTGIYEERLGQCEK
jgi:hypothetical protein